MNAYEDWALAVDVFNGLKRLKKATEAAREELERIERRILKYRAEAKRAAEVDQARRLSRVALRDAYRLARAARLANRTASDVVAEIANNVPAKE
jgi:hypothetical protein